jgi:hypothetical protein
MTESCPVHNWPLKDEQGCWVCYDERRLSGKQQKPKKLYQLPKVSEKKKARETKLAKVRQEKKRAIKHCETCGKSGVTLTYSHILSVKHYPEYESSKENALLECMECHTTWEHGSLKEKMKQSTWNRKLAFILANEPRHWNKMQLKSTSIT